MLAVRKEILTREKCRYVPITPLVVPSPGGGVSVDWYMATFWLLHILSIWQRKVETFESWEEEEYSPGVPQLPRGGYTYLSKASEYEMKRTEGDVLGYIEYVSSTSLTLIP